MHDNSKYNRHDAFSNAIKQKLEHHPLPVDDHLWDEIAPKLHPKPLSPALPWIITTVVALAGAAAFWYSAGGEKPKESTTPTIAQADNTLANTHRPAPPIAENTPAANQATSHPATRPPTTEHSEIPTIILKEDTPPSEETTIENPPIAAPQPPTTEEMEPMVEITYMLVVVKDKEESRLKTFLKKPLHWFKKRKD